MARTTSSNIDAAIASVDTETHDLIEITLPIAGGSPTVYYVGTAEVTIGATVYQRSIRAMPQITYTRGESVADGGEFTLENLSSVFGPIFLNQARPLDGSAVVVKRAFRVSPNDFTPVWEVDEIARGKMRVTQVTEEAVTAQFICDLADPSALIGGEQLTQRCILVFNKGGGTPTLVTTPCGWLLAQGGDANSCDHVLDSANGCAGHNNRHRFGGVPPLAVTAAIVSGSGPSGPVGPTGPGGYGPGGDGGGPRDCFAAGTCLLTTAGPKLIELFKVGDEILVWNFTQNRLVSSKVSFVNEPADRLTRKISLASGGSAQPTANELLWTGDRWQPQAQIVVEQGFASIQTETLVTDKVVAISDWLPARVHHLHVEHEDHNYIALDSSKRIGFLAHNAKPILLLN